MDYKNDKDFQQYMKELKILAIKYKHVISPHHTIIKTVIDFDINDSNKILELSATAKRLANEEQDDIRFKNSLLKHDNERKFKSYNTNRPFAMTNGMLNKPYGRDHTPDTFHTSTNITSDILSKKLVENIKLGLYDKDNSEESIESVD
jgi:uncharacterized protein YehS (DUF1456 family)